MFEKVLIPTDFSEQAHKILECIGDIPGLKEVVLLNVVARDPLARVWDPVAEARESEKKLALEKEHFTTPGISVKARAVSALEGDIPSAIKKVAQEENAQLVIMGARGKSLIQSALLGSASRNVLRFGDKHLLIMRYKIPEGLGPVGAKGTWVPREVLERPKEPLIMEKFCSTIFAKVLVPTDFSEPAEAAISVIKGIPKIGEIVLLHVVSKGETKEAIDANVQSATEKLNGLSQDLSAGGMKVTTRVVVGSPVEMIDSIAREEEVSLIAISSAGKETVKTGRIGSRTYDVANTADRPVLVVRVKPVF